MTEGWGGIPPDPDHRELMVCCYPGCSTNAHMEPLVVTGHQGAMRTFCRKHLRQLQGT